MQKQSRAQANSGIRCWEIRRSANCRELFLQNIHGLHNSVPRHITTFNESDWTIGTVTGSQSMINILKSPLLQQFDSLGCDVNFERTSFPNIDEPAFSNFEDSLQELSNKFSRTLQNDVIVLDDKYVSAPVRKRLVSMSSSISSCSDPPSSSASVDSFQGILQCTWKGGLPHHVFTVDDKREVYVANLSKIGQSNDKVFDYVYTFHLRKNGKNECNNHELELVGKMRVLTSIAFRSSNSEVKETQFILSVSDDNSTGEMQTSNHMLRKNNRLIRKVVDVFRSSHSNKQRSSSKFGGSNAIFENMPWDPSEENKYLPNLELAAIIVKDACNNGKEVALGGWGLKFLKKSGNDASLESLMPLECTRNTGECSTSINILIPAGFHGGQRTRIGGPSTLTERWIAGGHCDCGGWDIGCPLTILETRSSSTDSSFDADNSGECKSVDLFIQGSKKIVPIMKIVNIREDLHYIHFQSALSTLQSFAMAAALIHSHSPVLQSKVYST